MSQAKTPTLCYAIPFYKRMQTHLMNAAKHKHAKYIPGYGSAVFAGLQKLNMYFLKAQNNNNNILATGTAPLQNS